VRPFGGLAVLGLAAASCSDDGAMTGPGTGVASLVITPVTASFGAVGSTVQFAASALGPSGNPVSGADIAWC
jgi:hypothetical protein